MPPLVPATERANVPEVVTGDPLTVIRPPVNDCATLVTVPVGTVPLDAAVIRPCWSTVMLEKVYEAGTTAVSARLIVPVLVIGPPVRPVPVATDVTPEPAANDVQAPL